MDSCFVVQPKNTDDFVPECYHFMEGEFDWYEIQCAIRQANMRDEFKEELIEITNKCVDSKIPFDMYEQICFKKHGIPLLLIETEKSNQVSISLELNDYHYKSNLMSFLVFTFTILGIFAGFSLLTKDLSFS